MIRSLYKFILNKKYRPIVATTLFVISAGTITSHFLEGWGWIDSLYFCVITLATVGYGDITPKTDLGKIFTIIYIFSGIGIFLAFVQAYFDFIKKDKRI
ncbi:two pore domain potassium channel family protein [Candidatus Dojkabacteria bacterium]|nr:two pore domain potassium channel family protein [Candidatus Dojkabacteria bacterium]